nr:MAG TPA: hypothetical protein [Caudoviricetes sp.]
MKTISSPNMGAHHFAYQTLVCYSPFGDSR